MVDNKVVGVLLSFREEAEKAKEKKQKVLEYGRAYYAANKKTILEERASRYKSDQKFAKGKKEHAKAWMKKNKPWRKKGPVNGRSVIVGGYVGYTIGRLAKELDKPKNTVFFWIRRGQMPQSPIVTDSGIHLYTMDMIDVVKCAVGDKDRIGDKESFHSEIYNGWDELGIWDFANRSNDG